MKTDTLNQQLVREALEIGLKKLYASRTMPAYSIHDEHDFIAVKIGRDTIWVTINRPLSEP